MLLLLLDAFTWNADPEIFIIGPFNLPFPVSVPGLLIGAVLAWFGAKSILKKAEPRKKGSKDDKDTSSELKFWGIVLAGLVIGQLAGILLGLSTIEQFGPIAPRWYGLLFAMAFVSGYWIGVKMWKDAGRTVEELENVLFWVLIGTVIGARLGHVIFYDLDYYLRNLEQIPAIWNGGLASHGAAVGIIIAMIVLSKKKAGMTFLWLADRVVIPTAIGGAFIRTGNFFNSEIYGHPTDLPWGVIFSRLPGPDGMIPRHPTMLYEALLCIVVFIVLWTIYKKYKAHPPEGSLFGLFLIILFSGRFFLEYTKIPQAAFASEWSVNMGQWLSVPLVLIGLYIVFSRVNWKKKSTT